MDSELYNRVRSVWEDQKILLEDAKDSNDKDLIDRAYHDMFTVEETLSKLFGFTDLDYETWSDRFWNTTKRWEEYNQ